VNKDNKSKLLEHYGKTIAVDKQNGLVTMATIERIFDATILYYSNNHISRTYDDRIGEFFSCEGILKFFLRKKKAPRRNRQVFGYRCSSTQRL